MSDELQFVGAAEQVENGREQGRLCSVDRLALFQPSTDATLQTLVEGVDLKTFSFYLFLYLKILSSSFFRFP